MSNNNVYITKKSFMKRFLFFVFFLLSCTTTWAFGPGMNTSVKEGINNHLHQLIDDSVGDYRLEYFFAVTNDECDTAKVIVPSAEKTCTPNLTTAVDLTGSTASGKGKPTCDTGGGNALQMMDQWFKFTAASDTHVLSISNLKGTGTVRGVLYNNVQPNGTVVTCANLGGANSVKDCNISFTSTDSKFKFDKLVAGKEYILRLYTHGSSTKTFDMCLYTAPPAIMVSEAGEMYTIEELIKDVLVTATCDLVSNIRYQYGDGSPKTKVVKGIGYFNKNGADFPFEEGIVLGTGDVGYLGRSYKGYSGTDDGGSGRGTSQSGLTWAGDKDIQDLINDSGGKPASNDPRVSQVEFDFIPVQETVSFEYLFGSNSYVHGCTHTCGNGAMFGAWLIDTTTGIGENMAKLPGTTSPISMGTVKDIVKMGTCTLSMNPQFMDRYFAPGGLATNPPSNEAPVDLAAITVDMKSLETKVVPGRKYHIKLVVLDFCPTESHTSAAFFKAGSFDIGEPVLGTDMSIDGGNAACPGETVELGVNLNTDHYLIQWTKDGKDLVGENNAKLFVTTPGLYGAKLGYKDVNCDIEPKSVLVEYYDEIIFEKEPSDLVVCRSGEANTLVNLDKAMTGVTYSDVTFTYHESKADAETVGAPYLDPNYLMDSSLSAKTIWVKVQRNDTPCFEVRSFVVRLNTCTLALVDLPNIEVCQNENPNIAPLFDLTIYTNVVYHGRPGYTVTYHNSEAEAKARQNAIPTADTQAYAGTSGEEIWVRVEDNTQASTYAVTSFKLLINELPKINKTPTALYACLDSATATIGDFNLRSKDNEITFSASALQVSYYLTIQDARDGDPAKALNKDSYLSGEKEIYVRVQSLKTGCFSVGNLLLKLSPSIELIGANVYYLCSENGYASFNLDAIAGNKTKGNTVPLTFNYYKTQHEAELEVSAIVLQAGRYTNTIYGSEVVYLRVNNPNGCYKIQPIELKVEAAPKTATPKPIEVCATSTGAAILVDLTAKQDEILDGIDPATVIMRYYTSFTLAQDGKLNLAIADPTKYSNSMGNTVYVRVESQATACVSIESLTIKVNELPHVAVKVDDFETCDTAANTGIATFKLSDMKLKISADNSYLMTFHKTAADAQGGTNKLNETAYQNEVAFSQEIYVRVEDVKTGCFVVRQFFLKVNQYPIYDLSKGGVLIACTNSNAAQGEFNLVFAGQLYIPNHNDYRFTFFENLGDAQADRDNIRTPEAYTTQQAQTKVWIRIVDKKSGCVGIYEILLQVEKAPVLPVNLPVTTLCDTYGDQYDGVVRVDLRLHETVILQSLAPGHTGVITYYRSKVEAEEDRNSLVDPSIYETGTGSDAIWYRLTDSETGCYAVEFFEIKVNLPLRLEKPIPLVKCSDLSIGQNKATFDLSQNTLAIIGGVPIFGLVYEYYESEADALARINAIPATDVTKYVNKTTSQDIWIVITNELGCSAMVIQKISAEAMPQPNDKPTKLQTCEVTFGQGKGIFDLRLSERDILQGDASLSLTFHKTKVEAEKGEGALSAAEMAGYESASTKIYVRVENKNSTLDEKCFVIVELELFVNLKPKIVVKPYVICMATPTEFYEFDLETKNEEILNGRNKGDFRISYYEKEVDAIANRNALLYKFTNTEEDKQTIFVRVDDKITGCFHVEKLLLQIEQEVYAYDLKTPDNLAKLVQCSNLNNPKTATFDFTKFGEEILGEVQAASGYVVTYYLSVADYAANKPITPIDKIELPVGKYTIIAVVKSGVNGTYCMAETQFDIEVIESPTPPRLAAGEYVCVDYTTGKLLNPYTIDSGFDSSKYEFQWESRNGTTGGYNVIAGATKSYYVVEDITRGNNFRVVVKFKGESCPSTSNTVTLNFVEEIAIKVFGADSTGMVGNLDGEERITITVTDPQESINYEYAIDEGAYQDSRFFYDVANGSHRIWVRFKDGRSICPQYLDIFVLGYPKFFTPNGDGYNDTWNIPALKGHPEAVIYIYDRFGKLLKQVSPSQEGWDGTFNGKPMPSTDYWFTVEYLESASGVNQMPRKVQFKGHFSLKR